MKLVRTSLCALFITRPAVDAFGLSPLSATRGNRIQYSQNSHPTRLAVSTTPSEGYDYESIYAQYMSQQQQESQPVSYQADQQQSTDQSNDGSVYRYVDGSTDLSTDLPWRYAWREAHINFQAARELEAAGLLSNNYRVREDAAQTFDAFSDTRCDVRPTNLAQEVLFSVATNVGKKTGQIFGGVLPENYYE